MQLPVFHNYSFPRIIKYTVVQNNVNIMLTNSTSDVIQIKMVQTEFCSREDKDSF
jgi:hypothetical protein